ncbi:MAG: hypothetical protein IJ065_10960 [Eubacterium sp.]|nr:hypothetical protein [Eubacterium sp.]
MENLAKVDKLAEMTGASFDDARKALRVCNGETLDAMAYIEMHKVKNVQKRGSVVGEFKNKVMKIIIQNKPGNQTIQVIS